MLDVESSEKTWDERNEEFGDNSVSNQLSETGLEGERENIEMMLLKRNPINPVLISKQLVDKQQNIVVLIIDSKLESRYEEFNVRELSQYIFTATDALETISSNLSTPSPTSSGVSKSAVNKVTLRDIRRLDYQFHPHEDPFIFVRRHCVLFSIAPIRAVIMADQLIFIVPNGADSIIQILQDCLKAVFNANLTVGSGVLSDVSESSRVLSRTHSPYVSNAAFSSRNNVTDSNNFAAVCNIPFEAVAYEACLTAAIAVQTHSFVLCADEISKIVLHFKHRTLMPIEMQESMRMLKNNVNRQNNRIINCKKVLISTLDDIDDLALMNLSILKKHSHLYW